MNKIKTAFRLIACGLLVLQLQQPSFAALTSISQTPVDPNTIVAPNVIFGLDDSGSMDAEVMLDTNDGAFWYDLTDKAAWDGSGRLKFSYKGETGTNKYQDNTSNFPPTSQTGTTTTWYKYFYLFPNGSTTDGRRLTDGSYDHFAIPPTPDYVFLRSSDYNPLYYNPSVTYKPWVSAYIGSSTVTFSDASPTAARSHPAISGTTALTMNLTTNQTLTNANYVFRMQPGMKIPGTSKISGIKYKKTSDNSYSNFTNASDWTITGSTSYEVMIPYYPATYWAVDSTCTSGWPTCADAPDGTHLRKYEIKLNNSFPSGRSYADELQNFANWFTYYRKRKLMLSASMGEVLSGMTTIRGGLVQFNDQSAVTMYDFSSGTPASSWQAVLGKVYTNPASGGTPTRETLKYIGEQYKRTNTGAPIQYSCQRNAAMILTDGFAYANTVTVGSYNQSTYGGTQPYTTITSSSLADIALYYYTTNLRTDLDTQAVPVDTSDTSANADKNRDLHMNTYGLTLGALGYIYGRNTAQTNDPFTNHPTWPTTYQDRSPTSVDDLWHSTITGRGLMLTASDTSTATAKIQAALADILVKASAQSAVGVSRVNLKAGDSYAYVSSYQPNGWYGDVQAYEVNAATAVINSTTPVWSAQTKLDAKASTSRVLVTKDSGFIPFRHASMSTSLKGALKLSTTTDDSSDVVDWLRGVRTKEGTTYRSRAHVLGDLVYSEPAVTQAAEASYADTGYKTFSDSVKNRTRVIYLGGNDGILHAFRGSDGEELWGYIPSFVLPNLKNLASKTYDHQYFVDGSPITGDAYFQRGTESSASWKTVLVSGLRAGGSGYFAIDVTEPTVAASGATTAEEVLAGKVMWEFPNASTATSDANNVGLSFGKPIIAKVHSYGWVALLTSGYNNTSGDGKGHLFIVDIATGALLKDLVTSAGSTTSPSGLAQISAYVENGQIDATTEAVYGGDMQGNLWRFDLSDSDSANWYVAKLATLTDGTNAQPITTAPELASVSTNAGTKRMIFIGTGKQLANADLSDTQTQSFYGIVDDMTDTPTISNLRTTSLVRQTITINTTTKDRSISSNTVDFAQKKGWFFDLPTGERVSTDSVAAFGAIFFTSNLPSTVACASSSYLYTVSQTFGGPIDASTPPGKYLGSALASKPTVLVGTDGKVRVIVRLSDGKIVTQEPPIGTSGGVKTMGWSAVTR